MNVGDYVRINGEIGKIINCPEQLKKNYGNWLWFETTNEQCPIRNEDIIKSSPNIIDLIEVGDILTIRDIFGNLSKVEVDENFKLLSGKIISIVTHEQFSQMAYKVGGGVNDNTAKNE